MKKHDFIKTIGLGVILSLSAGFAVADDSVAKGIRPNILFIMTDQQHAGMMSCSDNKWLKTPALDGLAKGGIRFENAYSTNPVCVPSRTSMATGVMSCRLGAGNNRTGMQIAKLPAEVDENSMGKIMKRAGYDTFYGGKVHMCKSLAPRNAGYDVFHKDDRDQLPAECLKFITQKRDKPFFAVASFMNPHDICFAHIASKGKDRHGVLKLYKQAEALPLDELPPLPDNYELPENEPSALADRPAASKATTPSMLMRKTYDEKAWRIYRWIYHRLTEKVDKQIGQILDGLKEAGLEDNTLVIFTSDHGNMDASHKLSSKGIFYEESVGVPFLMKYKGHIPAGQVDQTHLVSSGLDILPTICDYAGVAIPNHLSGKSLRAVAEEQDVKEWRSYVVSENGSTRMIRTRNFKYCLFLKTGEESLVDMKNDPGEMENIASDPKFKDILAEHRAILADWARLSLDQEAKKDNTKKPKGGKLTKKKNRRKMEKESRCEKPTALPDDGGHD